MLTIKNVQLVYSKKQAPINIPDLTLQPGELIALMGPSGCGKSTTLNLVAKLIKPTSGVLESDFSSISYAFQEPRLFPWLTVRENLKAVLSDNTDDAKIDRALAFVGLTEGAALYPRELSGGMKSRVSLARALVYGGDLFLLDEPFAALDADLRAELCQKLRMELKNRNAAAILVTHDADDAATFADRIIEFSKDEF